MRRPRHAVEELERRGVRPWFVLDEGGAVAGGALPGLRVPLAVVGVTEKGVVSLLLRAEGAGGHASTPARMGPTARHRARGHAARRVPAAGERPRAHPGAVPPHHPARAPAGRARCCGA